MEGFLWNILHLFDNQVLSIVCIALLSIVHIIKCLVLY